MESVKFFLFHVTQETFVKLLTPELNLSAQRCLPHEIFTGDFAS
jgi:hypothetical protein